MKATVVEIKDGFAALLKEDGIIVKVQSENFKIGDVVNMKEKAIRKKGRLSAIVAAAAMFVMLFGGGVYAYATPSYYVSLDVNPGILMEVNIFERVIGMEAANEDAIEVLAGLDLKNKDIKDATSVAVERLTELGYFDGEDGKILIAAISKNEDKAERLAGKMQGAAEEEIAENGVKAEVAAGAVGYEMVQAAKAIEGMTPGKYNIIVNLLGIDPEVAADYAETSIKDLMAEYTASKGAEGKGRTEKAAAKVQTREENGKPAENEGVKERNAAGKAEQAGNQAGNAKVDVPASGKKALNEDAMENNAKEEKPETPEKPKTPKKPEKPVTPEKPEKPEVPVGGKDHKS